MLTYDRIDGLFAEEGFDNPETVREWITENWDSEEDFKKFITAISTVGVALAASLPPSLLIPALASAMIRIGYVLGLQDGAAEIVVPDTLPE